MIVAQSSSAVGVNSLPYKVWKLAPKEETMALHESESFGTNKFPSEKIFSTAVQVFRNVWCA
ncbi:hypothetical protein Tcan_16415 [Toxocara canis]|uniref:Uncharacterized protein n=1 Tax=Toxocara canis TaxID=6265 RepID=A0A0B2V3H7_TOXCA|nr:hypothetical protein Tcan_16415 [Toxocara canis]